MTKPTEPKIGRLLFDPQDHELLRIVNDVLERGPYSGWKRLLAPYMHPHGIKELAASKGLRIAHAVIHLLGSLERGQASDRLRALRALRDEVLTASESSLQKNTARVLIQIMKELVRARGQTRRQLELAHDFRRSISGKPRTIRTELARYKLLEMPEEWNQLAFDDHVHDANTKGRKSPTHLVMDAWIKGIRTINVVYYNFVRPEVAAELLEAADIMGVKARVSMEFRVLHMGRYAKLLWTPRGFADRVEFLDFLSNPAVSDFMKQGEVVCRYQRQYIWELLEKYNNGLREEIGTRFGVTLPRLEREEFLEFVGVGQPSVLHLAHCVSIKLRQATEGSPEIRLPDEEREPEALMNEWLQPSRNPDLPDPFSPRDDPNQPELLTLSPSQLVERIQGLHVNNWFTLGLADLSLEDILFLLYDCRGAITHLEVFNLRTYQSEQQVEPRDVLELRDIVNSANPVTFKRLVRQMVEGLEEREGPDRDRALAGLTDLRDRISEFLALYTKKPLRVRMGTDSTGQSRRHHGMGLVVAETLPPRARRQLRHGSDIVRRPVPVALEPLPHFLYRPWARSGLGGRLAAMIRNIPGLSKWGYTSTLTWDKGDYRAVSAKQGNLYTLGGMQTAAGRQARSRRAPAWTYMNSNLKNILKILLGFLPAALSFKLTKSWWVLAWLGPFIWFGITGLRNVIQSVLGSGGFRRSPLLKWNDYVSWERLSDSLLYTGFSVPLLDYLVKIVLLDRGMGINTDTNPIALYTVMAVVNGMYLYSHNTLRGLPRKAAVGNFFRSVLSIPLAVLFNAAIGGLLGVYGVPSPADVLQKWAAIISKTASDCVAGVIEGLADRSKYMALRARDMRQKFRQIFDVHAQLEVLYPQEDAMELLGAPGNLLETFSYEGRDLDKVVIVNGLDCMYLWMYQPRTRTVLSKQLRAMSQVERRAFLLSQYVLRREKEISLLLVDGLVGKRFNKALAFYLDNHQSYLDQIQALASRP